MLCWCSLLHNSSFWWPLNYFRLINVFNILIIILKFSIKKTVFCELVWDCRYEQKYLILGYMEKEMIVSMCHGRGSGTADMNMKYLILGYMQKEMIVSMCHGRGTGTADMNMKYLIIGNMQKEMIVPMCYG